VLAKSLAARSYCPSSETTWVELDGVAAEAVAASKNKSLIDIKSYVNARGWERSEENSR
jgi:hypothetical protein